MTSPRTPYQLCERHERSIGDYRSVCPTSVEEDDDRFAVWSEYLSRWSLTYPVRLELSAEREWISDGRRGYYLRIGFHYPDERDSADRSKPAPRPVRGLLPPSLYPDGDTPRWLRSNLLYHLTHELDEHLRLDGVTVFDPHAQVRHVCDDCLRRGPQD